MVAYISSIGMNVRAVRTNVRSIIIITKVGEHLEDHEPCDQDASLMDDLL